MEGEGQKRGNGGRRVEERERRKKGRREEMEGEG